METLKNNWKRYLVSSIVTFVASFLLVAVPQLLDESFEWSTPTVVGVVMTSVRLGLKAVWEILQPVLMSLLRKKETEEEVVE